MAKKKAKLIMEVSLTKTERLFLNHLTLAWNLFLEMEDVNHNQQNDMRHALDMANSVLAVRVAKRADPEIWR